MKDLGLSLKPYNLTCSQHFLDCGYSAHFDCQANASTCPLAVETTPNGTSSPSVGSIGISQNSTPILALDTSTKNSPKPSYPSLSLNGSTSHTPKSVGNKLGCMVLVTNVFNLHMPVQSTPWWTRPHMNYMMLIIN